MIETGWGLLMDTSTIGRVLLQPGLAVAAPFICLSCNCLGKGLCGLGVKKIAEGS